MNQKRSTKDVAVTVLVPQSLHMQMKVFAKSRGMSLAAFFRQAGIRDMENHNLKQAA
jgi:hypothetical protein